MPNDELTPEEKLLRVIQDGDGAKASGKAGVVSAGPEVPAPPTAESPVVTLNSDSEPDVMPATSSAKGNLKLAEKPKGSTQDKPLAVPADAPAAPASGGDMILSDEAYGHDDLPDDAPSDTVAPEEESVAATAATPVRKKRAAEVDGVLRVNRLLLLAVLLILALIGVEIWANISAKPLPAPEPGDMTLPEPVETTLPPWPVVLGVFEEKEWFPKPKTDDDKPDPLDQNAIAAFLKQNVKLVGLSTLPDGTPEALIADLLPDKMHFVKVSDRLELGGSESPKLFTLKSIGSDHVVLSDGSDDYTVK